MNRRLQVSLAPRRDAVSMQCGVSLIELMVALVIGLFMMGGAITVYLKARDTYATTDATARLQENARYALSVIETDVRMSDFWGLTNRYDAITADGSSTFPTSCGANFATDATNYVTGTNNTYSLSSSTCAAYGAGAQSNSDVLITRHASATRLTYTASPIAVADRNRVLVISSRTAGDIFVPKDNSNWVSTTFAGSAGAGLAATPPLLDLRQMNVSAYYVSQDSSVAAGYPGLRRKYLITGPAVADEEILPGVENMQFQLGVDTNADGTADMFVNPGSVPAGGTPVSVRVWLLMRAQDIDVSYTSSSAFAFGDQNIAAPGDHYRRMLVAKTIQLRNARL
jgi:type IV pilus assembly protein PilW